MHMRQRDKLTFLDICVSLVCAKQILFEVISNWESKGYFLHFLYSGNLKTVFTVLKLSCTNVYRTSDSSRPLNISREKTRKKQRVQSMRGGAGGWEGASEASSSFAIFFSRSTIEKLLEKRRL